MTHLATCQLGRTDMMITRLGIGTWAIGGGGWAFGWGPQDDADSTAAIRRAVEAGLNWIDTAAIYGLGHSEEVVGKTIAALPEADRPLVFTKGGLIPNNTDRMGASRRSATTASIRREAEASLRRLGVERIDLYQVHWPADDAAIEEYWAAMAGLQQEGKVRAIGLSNHNLAQLAAAEAITHVDSLQPPFSLIRREAASELIPWCAAHQTGVIVYSPMQAGLLTGAVTAARIASLPADDWRSSNPEFQSPRLEANLELVAALRPVAERHAATTAAIAIAWVLTFPGVTGAIAGARHASQIDDWLAAASLQLTAADLAEITGALAATGAGAGPLSAHASASAGDS
jgi:aryl-alcohol dehydrogenase-like predicted oxidoreductase